MKIMDFLSEKAILVDLKSTKKGEVLEELTDLLISAGEISEACRAKMLEGLHNREALGSTAIGQGVAIPHSKTDCVSKLTAAFAISRKGIDFDSLDGEPAHIFFMLAAPLDSAGPHLKALARISRLLKDKYFRDALRNATDVKSVIAIISQEDDKKP